jgi:hypothetical protein
MLYHYAGVRTINKMAVGEMCVYAKNKKQIPLLQSYIHTCTVKDAFKIP